MIKMDDRLDQLQTDIAVIKEKQNHEVIKIKADIVRIEADQQELRNEVKQVQDKLASRDRTLVVAFITAGIGFLFWLIQEIIRR